MSTFLKQLVHLKIHDFRNSIYIYIYIYMHTRACTHTHTHTHTYIYIYIYIYVCVCVCVCVRVRVCAFVCKIFHLRIFWGIFFPLQVNRQSSSAQWNPFLRFFTLKIQLRKQPVNINMNVLYFVWIQIMSS